MNAVINHKLATDTLISTIQSVKQGQWIPSDERSEIIKCIILGSHLTYRYILLNGILAKATNEKCNPLALQAGANLRGAFDARSLCHDVVVPIERDLLNSKLGGSNEPFLNKPARYTELSEKNPVRGGNDTKILHLTINVLSNLRDAKDASIALHDCIYWTLQRPSHAHYEYSQSQPNVSPKSTLIRFAELLASESMEGESSAILTGLLFSLIGTCANRNLDIRVHKVNQPGSSSNEISDVDVFDQGKLIWTAEVKDKTFTRQDVEHAVIKVITSKYNELLFIKGPRGLLINDTEQDLIESWRAKGFNLTFVNLIASFSEKVFLAPHIEPSQFMEWVHKYASQASIKDLTFRHINQCARDVEWLTS